MFEIFKRNPNLNDISRQLKIPKALVLKAVDEGWPEHGHSSFSHRIKEINKNLELTSDYNEVMNRKKSLHKIGLLEERIYGLLGAKFENIGLDEAAFKNLSPSNLLKVSGVLKNIAETKIQLSSGIRDGSKGNEGGSGAGAEISELLLRGKDIIDQ